MRDRVEPKWRELGRPAQHWPAQHWPALHWPALLIGSACVGLGLANWLQGEWTTIAALAAVALPLLAAASGALRVVALGVLLAAVGLWWGSLRLEAMDRSVLASEVGGSGDAELVVSGPPRRTTWAVRAAAEVRSFRERRIHERVLLVLPVGRSPPRGAILEANVRVAEPRAATTQGGFDERRWLARQGIHVVLRASSWRQVGRRGGVAGFGDRLRERVERAVSHGAAGTRRALVLGVVLGEDEGLSDRVRLDFRRSGLYHLLAVSGQNVAFIALGIYGLGWLARLPRLFRELLVLAAIASYVLAVGWQPSVVRAGVAGALASLAWIFARPRDRWHFLAVGALILLAWTPTSLLEPGFQLSFAAVAAIFVALPGVQRLAEGYPVPRRVAEALGVATVCGLVTAPIVLVQFHSAPIYTVPANVLAEPAMPCVLGLGLLAGVADPVSPDAAAALAWLAGWAAAWLGLVARVVSGLPGAAVGPRSAVCIGAVTGALALAARQERSRLHTWRWTAIAAGSCLAIVAGAGVWSLRAPPRWEAPVGLRVTFLDVGQGDAALLETRSARVLVDEGPPEAHVATQLSRMGIHALSAIVLTHPERDHVGGAADVVRGLRVGVVLDPFLAATGPDREEAVAAARERGVPVREVRAGSEFRVGGLALRVLSPEDAGLPSENPNLNAVVLVASYGETDVFLPADAESEVTAHLALQPVEVLKVAHHGSEDPGLADELRVLRPRIAVISVGRGNEYGHPRPGALAALAAAPGLSTFRTDRDGRVVVEADERGRLRVRTDG